MVSAQHTIKSITRTEPVFSAIHKEFPRTSISKACPFNLIGDPRPTIFFSFSCLAFRDLNSIVNPPARVQFLLTRSRMSSASARRKLDLSGLLDMMVAGIQVARERSDRRPRSFHRDFGHAYCLQTAQSHLESQRASCFTREPTNFPNFRGREGLQSNLLQPHQVPASPLRGGPMFLFHRCTLCGKLAESLGC